MSASSKRTESKASKTRGAKKNIEELDILPVGRVDRQVLRQYVDGFPDLVEETRPRSKKANSKSKNSESFIWDPIIWELDEEEEDEVWGSPKKTQQKKTMPASAKTKPAAVVDKSRGRNKSKSDSEKELDFSGMPIYQVEEFDEFLCIELVNGPTIHVQKPQQSKNKSSDKQKSTDRSLRSSRKYEQLSSDRSIDSSYFSIYSVDWYNLNKALYDDKLATVLSDFAIPRENRRDGNARTFYNYLLLDSRRCRAGRGVSWESFVDAIFYLGKGKGQRSRSHTKEAEEYYSTNKRTTSKKIERIVDIWKTGRPVLLLEFANNIISEEAYTREALMIEAIGKGNCCNVISGTYYGVAATMKPMEKRRLGVVLLMEARECFVADGAFEEFPKEP